MLFSAGLSFNAICVARSALSSYLDCKDSAQFGEHKRVRQFIKAVFEKRPAPHKPVSKNALARWLDKCSTEQVLTLHNSAHTVHVQPAHRQRCPVACQWTLCYERQDGARSQHLPGSGYRKEPAVNMGQALLDSYLHKN